MNLAFCSSCDHSEEYGVKMGYVAGMTKEIPKPKFCVLSGAPMLYGCSQCGTERGSMDAAYCAECGKAYSD